MTTVAFLQNTWAKDPARVSAMLQRQTETFRRAFIRRLLFAGCVTGNRLARVFGDFQDITWENVSREICARASDNPPPDLFHVRKVLWTIRPRVVLTFGNVATAAVAKVWRGPTVATAHPAARGDIMPRLYIAARTYEEMTRTLEGQPLVDWRAECLCEPWGMREWQPPES